MARQNSLEPDDAPGLRDAEEVLRRARQDEVDALEARERYRAHGLPRIDVDGPVIDRLHPDERVVDVRQSAVVSRHLPETTAPTGLPGRLYLTTRRLLLLGHEPLDVDLAEIDELAVAGERLLVTLRDATGLSIDASRPRLLRVQIAAALAAVRPGV